MSFPLHPPVRPARPLLKLFAFALAAAAVATGLVISLFGASASLVICGFRKCNLFASAQALSLRRRTRHRIRINRVLQQTKSLESKAAAA